MLRAHAHDLEVLLKIEAERPDRPVDVKRRFRYAGDGLVAQGGELKGFAVAGADQKFVWANAELSGTNSVTVWSDSVAEPVAVRYGWADNPECTLYNQAGLPASPFRTDE